MDASFRRMEEEMRALAIELEWDAGEVPGFQQLANHFQVHMPIQQATRRAVVERAARISGVDVAAGNLATMLSVVDRFMLGVTSYLNTDYEITTPQEAVAVTRFAKQLAADIAAMGAADRRDADVTQILAELRRITPSHLFDQLVGRFWDARRGALPEPVSEALALPAGPELSEEVPPPPETERTRAAKRLTEWEEGLE